MNKKMIEIKLDDLVQMASLMATIAGTVGSGSALFVDFTRRRIRAKTAEYAAASDFSRITNAVDLLQNTLESHVDKTAQNHSEICQRVSHLEGRYDARSE